MFCLALIVLFVLTKLYINDHYSVFSNFPVCIRYEVISCVLEGKKGINMCSQDECWCSAQDKHVSYKPGRLLDSNLTSETGKKKNS